MISFFLSLHITGELITGYYNPRNFRGEAIGIAFPQHHEALIASLEEAFIKKGIPYEIVGSSVRFGEDGTKYIGFVFNDDMK